MDELTKLRQISQDFRRVSSALLLTTVNDDMAYVKRFYTYINGEPVIKSLIDAAINESDYDCEQFIVDDGMNRQKFNIPEKEVDHVKAMYDLLQGLVEHDPPINLSGYCYGFDYKRNFNESIKSFLDKAFRPLINFVTGSLSKEMMVLEQKIPRVQYTQNIQTVQGTANMGENVTSHNNTFVQSDLKEIMDLMAVFKDAIENSSLDAEEKESALDDLMQIKEQLESDAPNQTRMKKAVSGIKSFIGDLTTKVAANMIACNAPEIVAAGNAFLQGLGCA